MRNNSHIFFIDFSTTKAIWIVNFKLNSCPAKQEFSSGPVEFRFLLLFSVHFPNWLSNLAPRSAEKSPICRGIVRDELIFFIVKWFWSPANIKGTNKDAKIYVGRSTTVHNLLFCSHTLCMNYVANTFLLVSSSVRSKQLLCFVHGQGQKSEQKHTTKNFVMFHNHSLLLTIIFLTNKFHICQNLE